MLYFLKKIIEKSKMSSAAVVIGVLRVKIFYTVHSFILQEVKLYRNAKERDKYVYI